jgi:hypothetical protein
MRYFRSGFVVPLLLISHFVLAASPESSHHLRIADGVNGQNLEGVFDFSWWPLGDRAFYSVRSPCASSGDIGDVAGALDPAIFASPDATLAPLVSSCTTCHCQGGGFGCEGCSSNHASDITIVDYCILNGCNENYCKSVINRCCTLCSQTFCPCHAPGYCTQ